MRTNVSENHQISPSTTVRAAQGDGSCPNLTSILPEGRKTANIHASSGVIGESRLRRAQMTDDQFGAILKELRQIYLANTMVGVLMAALIAYFLASSIAHLF